MLRLRPYKPMDAGRIVTWVEDRDTFSAWCANHMDWPLTEAVLQEFCGTFESQEDRWLMTALDEEGVEVSCIVEVCITDNEGIHQTNLEMRGVDAPTDVLSFPMFDLTPGEKPQADWADPDTDKVLLGDMMISLERAQAQAEEYGHSLEREVCYLGVHSVLHLLGYDHLDEGPQKRQMRQREETILGKLGIVRTD